VNLMSFLRGRRKPPDEPDRDGEIAEQQVKSDETKRVVDDILAGMRQAERIAVSQRTRRR
jgi:hypothetical protein